MNVNALKADELAYELEYRNVNCDGMTVADKRKSLRVKFTLEKLNASLIQSYAPIEYDVNEELKLCITKLTEIDSLIQNFASTRKATEYERLNTRLAHILNRLNRLNPTGDLLAIHSQTLARCIELIDELGQLYENDESSDDECSAADAPISSRYQPNIVDNQEPNANSTAVISNRVSFPTSANFACNHLPPIPNASTGPATQPHSDNDATNLQDLRQALEALHYSRTLPINNNRDQVKSIPVCKWDIKFTGDTSYMGVNSFLQRVEELRVARNISSTQLFDSAVDLFSSQGLVWFRSIRNTINNWDQLVEKLRFDFLPTDFDDELWEEIKRRKQGSDERPSIFIASMRNLFSRLQEYPSEAKQLKQVLRNLQPYYATQLALTEVTCFNELITLCKRLEDTRLQNAKYRNPNNCAPLQLEPDLMYKPHSSAGRKVSSGVVSSISMSSPAKGSTPKSKTKRFDYRNRNLVCWNCKLEGHSFRTCMSADRNVFCFVCGYENVYFARCPRCNPKNADAGESSSVASPPPQMI
uniref:CCHC-type domain-containing protein n=1 Tax=Photinus pyralis TaxID=7054 RepID=A0A1Y1JVF9_PHOPY